MAMLLLATCPLHLFVGRDTIAPPPQASVLLML